MSSPRKGTRWKLPFSREATWEEYRRENLDSQLKSELLTALQPLRNLLPGVNAGSLVWSLAPGGGSSGEAPPGVVDAVTGGRATLSLALYVAAFLAAGAVLVRRRDVT